MADATQTLATPDQITAVDVAYIAIHPLGSTVFYTLRLTWQSGNVTMKQGQVTAADFVACLGSFCQATPKKKFLTWLVTNNYETNLTVN